MWKHGEFFCIQSAATSQPHHQYTHHQDRWGRGGRWVGAWDVMLQVFFFTFLFCTSNTYLWVYYTSNNWEKGTTVDEQGNVLSTFAAHFCRYRLSRTLTMQSIAHMHSTTRVHSLAFPIYDSTSQHTSPAKTRGYSTHQPQYPQNWRHLQYSLRNTPPPLNRTSLMTCKGFPVIMTPSWRFQNNRQCSRHVMIGPAHHSPSKRSSLRNHSLTPRANRSLHYHSNDTSYSTIGPLLPLPHRYLCPRSWHVAHLPYSANTVLSLTCHCTRVLSQLLNTLLGARGLY